MKKVWLFIAFESLFSSLPSFVLSVNATWTLNANGNWNVNGNWSPAIFPNSIDSTANFLNVITASRTITLGQNITIGTVIFNDNNNYIISGANTLIFDVSSGNAAITIFNTNGNGAHRINSNLLLNRNVDISSSSTATFQLLGNISGAGGISWAGSNVGNLLVNGTNSYTGPTNIYDGLFTYNHDGCIPTTNLVTIGTGSSSNSPTLAIADNMTVPISVLINSDGTLTQNNNRTVQLLSLSGSGQVNLSLGNTNANLFEINGATGNEFSGVISGGLANVSTNPNTNNRVYKDGPSIQVLSGNSDYVSRTFIAQGAINAQSNNALGAPGSNSGVFVRSTGTSGSLYLQNNITLTKTLFINGFGYASSGAIQNVSGNNTINGNVQIGWSGGAEIASDVAIQLSAGSLNISGVVSGSNKLTVTGNGTLIYSDAIANTLSGITIINSGTLQLNKTAGVNALASDVQINGTGTLQLLNANQIINTANVTLSGGTFNLNGNSEVINTLFFNNGTLLQGGAVLSLASSSTALSMRNTSITGDLLLTGGGDIVFDNVANGTASISGNIDLGGTFTKFNIADGTAAVDMQISGVISNGGLNKLGMGTLVLLGTNTYGGGTTVSSGTLQGNTTSLQGNITDNANLVFDQTSSGTYSSMISGLGTLVKQGIGALTLSNTNVVAGSVAVNEGTLLVNGSLGGGNSLNAAAGTMLGGTGTITKNCTINGILAPGNSIGTIHFVGTQTLGSGSTLEIELNATNADLVDVIGTMSIQPNTTLHILLESGSYAKAFSNSYTIVQTTGGVTGVLTSIQNALPLLQTQVVYTLNDVLLEVAFKPISDLFPSGKAGQVAKCLDAMSSSDSQSVINELRFLTSTSAIKHALLQMQPSLFTSLAIAQENNTYYIQNVLKNQLEDRKRRCSISEGFVFWASPLIGRTFQGNQNSEAGFRATSPGIVAGGDIAFSSNGDLGFALAYTYTDLKWKKKKGNATIQNGYASLYGKWSSSLGYIEGSLIGAYNFYNTTRNIEFANFKRKAHAKHNGWEGAADLKGGMIFSWGGTHLSPFLDLGYVFLHEQQFNERGARSLDLIVKSKNSDLLSPEIGVEVSHCVSKDSFFMQVGVIRETRFIGQQEKGTFACHCCTLDVSGLYPSRFLGTLSLGINLNPSHLDFISLFYEGKYGNHFQDHSVYLQIAY